jgi:L-threonylcarbamoyladenylate synthase
MKTIENEFDKQQLLDVEISKSINVLKKGGSILYPTDTIWGIGCDATNSKAVEKIYKIKERHDKQNFIVLIDDENNIKKYIEQVPPIAYDLIKQYNRPLTIIYPNARNIAKNVSASDGSLAIRVVNELFCKQLIRLFGNPIVSTSANISGDPFPVSFSSISEKIAKSVDYIVDWEREKIHDINPSTIIRLYNNGSVEVLRN